jgi:hypothetical protein
MTQMMQMMAAGGEPPWYRAGGAPLPVAAYQPKGAASLAASYVNLATPGVNDAAHGVAPTWASGTGWGFSVAQWLNSGVIFQGDWSVLVRFSNYVVQNASLCGKAEAGRNITLNPQRLTTLNRFGYNAANYDASPGYSSGVVGTAANTGYMNGVFAVTLGVVWSGGTLPLVIGANSGGANPCTGNIQALAIYNTTLTASQVAAVSAAMAAL